MIETVNKSRFIDAFKSWDTYKNNFSYNGLVALYEYLTDLEEETNEPIELDVVAIACDYTEYSTAVVCASEYRYEFDKDQSAEEQEKSALEWLQNETTVIEFDRGIIIQQF